MQIWRMLKARRYVILAMVLLGIVAGAIVAKMMPNQYAARARLVVDMLRPDPVTGVATPPKTLESYVTAQVELIRDIRVTGRVVDALGWEKAPSLRAQFLRNNKDDQVTMRSYFASQVANNTNAYLIRNTPILEIAYTSTTPDAARRGADALRDAFLMETLDGKRQEAARNAEWFSRQATELKQRLAAAEGRKAQFEKANNIVLQDDNTDAESAKLRAIAGTAPAAPMPSVSVGGAVSSPSAAQLAQVDAQLASARRTLGANHPDIIALQQQRSALAAAAGREMAASRAASRPVSSGPSLSSMLSAQTQKVLAQRGLVGEAQRLAGDVSVLRDQVTKTMQRSADFQLQAQSTDTGFQRLGSTATPQVSSTPGLFLFVLAGLAVGAALGVVLALLLEILFRRVRGVEDLQIDGLPVIGTMSPSAAATEQSGLLGWLGLSNAESART
ncbi:GumC family protein [Sphingomonas turrisvirgatae]|nr:Wzz/FepE/Etk N-terminal domain-containing protein [Sphingomonas turrisvirgatae]